MAHSTAEPATEEKLDTAFDQAIKDLAYFKRRNAMMLRRMRNLAVGTSLAFLLSLGTIGYAGWTNGQRITEIQHAREAAIIYSCREMNQAHVKTLIFLDKTELKQLHKHVGPRRYPVIERHTLAVLHDLLTKKRSAALSSHRLLLAFLDNLAPRRNCLARAHALSSGQTTPSSY